jgi:S-adenosylmethionine hydrolase
MTPSDEQDKKTERTVETLRLEMDRSFAELRTALALKAQELANDLKLKGGELSNDLKLVESKVDAKMTTLDAKIANLRGEISDSISAKLRILSVAGTVLALAVFFGAPEYFKMSLQSKVAGYDKDVKTLTTQLDEKSQSFQAIIERASRQHTIVLASDYRETDAYPQAIFGRIAAAAPELPRPVYVQLPLNNQAAAAAKLTFLLKYFPQGTVIAAVYNPDGFESKQFVSWLKTGQIFIGNHNEFAASVVRAAGGSVQTAWLERLPDSTTFGDSPLWGLSRIAPAAAILASPRSKEIKGADFGGVFSDQSTATATNPAGGISGWVINVDGYGNCLTSIAIADLKHRFGDQFDHLNLKVGSETVAVSYFRNFADAQPGTAFAIDFDGFMNLAVKTGSFADLHPACKEGAAVTTRN